MTDRIARDKTDRGEARILQGRRIHQKELFRSRGKLEKNSLVVLAQAFVSLSSVPAQSDYRPV